MELLWDGLTDALRMLRDRDPLVIAAAWRSIWVSGLAVAAAAGAGILAGLSLARCPFRGRTLLVVLFRAGMGMPTVLIGLLGYAILSRRGPLGGLELLYTPWAIVLCEFFLALPIVVTWTHGAIRGLDPRVAETARTLGASAGRRAITYLSEARLGVILALLTAFGRCVTELGVAMMVGGNIKHRTRTLATATALETSRGELARGMAMSILLLVIGLLVAVTTAWLARGEDER